MPKYTPEEINTVLEASKSSNFDDLEQALNNLKKLGEIDWDQLVDERGCGPLHIVTILGYDVDRIIPLLIKNGTNVNVMDNLGYTPLHMAAGKGLRQVFELLIIAGANVNAETPAGETPLHTSIRLENKDSSSILLIENGANVNAIIKTRNGVNDVGCTPLYLATVNEDLELMDLLIKKGADVDAAIDNNASRVGGYTPLHAAARFKNEGAIALLVNAKANVKAKDSEGKTPLHHAANKGAKLIEAGADIDAVDNAGCTPLHYCARYSDKNVVAFFIKAGANVMAKDNEGKTPLHYAAGSGDKDAVALLIEAGAKVDEASDYGTTPLHHAAIEGKKAAIASLIAAGADVNVVYNYNGEHTPLSSLLKHRPNDYYAIGLLVGAGAKVSDNAPQDVKNLQEFLMKALVILTMRSAQEVPRLSKESQTKEQSALQKFPKDLLRKMAEEFLGLKKDVLNEKMVRGLLEGLERKEGHQLVIQEAYIGDKYSKPINCIDEDRVSDAYELKNIVDYIVDEEEGPEEKKFSNNLIKSLEEQVARDSKFGEYFLKITRLYGEEKMPTEDIVATLKESLHQHDIVVNGKINPALANNPLEIRKVAEEFASKLLEREAVKVQGNMHPTTAKPLEQQAEVERGGGSGS